MKQAIVWALVILLGIGCRLIVPTETPAPATSEAACQPSRLLNADGNGQAVQLRVGEVLGIDLESNPSTGYEWLVDEIEPGKMTDMGLNYIGGGNMPGDSSTQRLCFRVVGAGTTNLRLIYRQPWDVKVTPDAYGPPDFEITIEINE